MGNEPLSKVPWASPKTIEHNRTQRVSGRLVNPWATVRSQIPAVFCNYLRTNVHPESDGNNGFTDNRNVSQHTGNLLQVRLIAPINATPDGEYSHPLATTRLPISQLFMLVSWSLLSRRSSMKSSLSRQTFMQNASHNWNVSRTAAAPLESLGKPLK